MSNTVPPFTKISDCFNFRLWSRISRLSEITLIVSRKKSTWVGPNSHVLLSG